MEQMPRARAVDANAVRFGAIVYRLRMGRDWTLEDLAKVSGMNADWLGVLERGLNVPSLTTILRLADAFGVEAAALVHEVAYARELESAKSSVDQAPAPLFDDG